jgi:membrane protein YdbS with pleckstrin-like domain
MPYPRKLLNDYETVALDVHPHWWYFAEAAFALLAAIVLGIVVLALDADSWLKWLSLILIVASALWLLVRYVRWGTTNFVITSDRVIFRHGVIAKSGTEIPLERVNAVHFDQGIFERMIGAGDLLIESGADQGQSRFTDVRNPDRVQNLIHSQMELNEDRMYGRVNRDGTPVAPVAPAAPAAPVAPGSQHLDVPSQLEKLEGMRDRGTITPEEFEVQKRRLLDT